MHIQKYTPVEPCFSMSMCDRIQRLCDTIQTEDAKTLHKSGSKRQSSVRRCKSGWLHMDSNNGWLFKEIWGLTNNVNSALYGFEIDEIESLQYLEYGPLNFFRWHTDNGADRVGTRKLSVIIQLSEPSEYVGGQLQIKAQEPNVPPPKARGSVTIFPSHLLHRATPVWLGKRKVLVAWIRGKQTLR